MNINLKQLEKDLDRSLADLNREDLEQWRKYDMKILRKERIDRFKAPFIRFDEWFARKFGWFFSPRRYK